MAVRELDDQNHELLSRYGNVPDPELLAREGLFVAEGRLVVERLLAQRALGVRSVMVTPPAYAAIRAALEARPEVPVYVVPQPVMNGIVGFNIHRGCLALGERPAARDWRALTGTRSRLLVLEGIGNADNVGALFRNGAAFGVDAVLLGPSTTDPLYRKAIRTSMAASLTMPYAEATPWPQTLCELPAAGFAVVGLTPAPAAQPLRDVAAVIGRRPVALVLGHEGSGLTSEALAACEWLARIPMARGTDSLNVATAAAVALYELARG